MSGLVLGIETSCDETAAAVVADGRRILSNVVGTQTAHAGYGGVVPELAARAHVEMLPSIVESALDQAGVTAGELTGVAATRGPGLIGALVVGFSWGKAAAASLDLPFAGVHHLEGHVFSAVLQDPRLEPPFVALVVSGGHTSLYEVRETGRYKVLGATVDDAAGEAFDKVARLLGLGFPGGPLIDKLAVDADPQAIAFPRAMRARGFDFSFSGVKTAVLNYIRDHPSYNPADVAASFQEAVVDVQVSKTVAAAEAAASRTVVVGGGVAANTRLRAKLGEACARHALKLVVPSPALCVDNGAMIAAAGSYRLSVGDVAPPDASADARLPLPS